MNMISDPHHIPIKYIIPEILVGREREKQFLLEKHENAIQGTSEMVFVNGPPGIGKSALIREVERAVASKKGFFIWGKYDQYRRNVPLSAIIQAFTGLINRIVSLSENQIASFREKIMDAVGQNGKIITDLIPLSEMIIGKQPPVPDLDTEERKNRFNRVFRNFFKVFTNETHPLTIFLDDIQWADTASIDLLESFLTAQTIQYFYLIGSYRNEDLTTVHPLTAMLNTIGQFGKKISSIELGPLTESETCRIIMNFLKSDEQETRPLAKIVHKKTFGNPFFIHQFMKTLYEEQMIQLDIHKGWLFDLDRIRKERVTDNVVTLLSEKISKLPEPVIEMLKICACIGNRYDLETLSKVRGGSIEETMTILETAVDEGYIAIYQDMYRFQHDRIEEAVVALIPQEEKKKRHYEIGKMILENTSEARLPDQVIYIAGHLNKGKKYLNTEERRIGARLNLMAVEKSVKSNAYSSALVYLREGASLLDETTWETDYRLAYTLYKNLMQCEYLCAHFEKAERIFKTTVHKAQSIIDKVDLYILMVHLKSIRGEFEEAIKLGFEGFQIIGYPDVHEKSSLEGLIAEYEKTKTLIAGLEKEGIALEDIHLFPDKDDPVIFKTIKLIGYISTPAIVVNPLLAATVALKPLNFMLEHRAVFVRSSYSFPGAGTIICGIFKNYTLGSRIGRIGLTFPHTVAQFFLSYGNCIVHWNTHVRASRDCLIEGYRFGMEVGQFDVAAICLVSFFRLRLLMGEILDQPYEELTQYDSFLNSNPNPFIVTSVQILKFFHHGLKGTEQSYFIDIPLEELKQNGKLLYYLSALLMKLILHYVVDEEMDLCYDICKEANNFSHGWLATTTMPEYYLFYSLVLAAKIHNPIQDTALLEELKKNIDLFKTWSDLCPENYQHRYVLVQAELANVEKRFVDAEAFYHKAIRGASAQNFIHHEAISNECAAKFYLKRGLDDIARMYMKQAYECFGRWGAEAKLRKLEIAYPELIPSKAEKDLSDRLKETKKEKQ